MKKLLTFIMLFATTLFLVSCGKKGEIIDFSDTFGKKSVVRVWIDDEQGDYMKAVIEEFNKVHPSIQVVHQHKGSVDSREHLKTFGPSGNGADVFQFPHDHLAQAVLEDLVLPLPKATADLVKERSHELGTSIATLFYNQSEGTFDPEDPNAVENLFAVPMSLESVGLFYNKDLVATPAATYEELLAAGKVWNATELENEQTNAQAGNYYLGNASHWADSYFIQHIYSAFGFTPFGENLNDPTAVGFEKLEGALTWMLEELKPVATGTGATDSIGGGELFEAGKIPYVIGGPWNIEAYKKAGIDFGIAPLPSINGNETQPFAGAMMAAVYKYSSNQADAIKFVEFLSSDVAMRLQYEMKSKLPALKAELTEQIVDPTDMLMAVSRQLEKAVPMPTIPQVTYYWGPGEAMVKEVWNNSKPVAEAVEEAEVSYGTLSGLAGN